MNPDPDYSAAYVTMRTDDGGADGSGDGYGLVFTIGRGNDVAVAAIEALATHVVGMPVPDRPSVARRPAPAAGRATRSCAGSDPRRASCTWRSAPCSTPPGISPAGAPGCRCGSTSHR